MTITGANMPTNGRTNSATSSAATVRTAGKTNGLKKQLEFSNWTCLHSSLKAFNYCSVGLLRFDLFPFEVVGAIVLEFQMLRVYLKQI